jgi:hypothetical protein
MPTHMSRRHTIGGRRRRFRRWGRWLRATESQVPATSRRRHVRAGVGAEAGTRPMRASAQRHEAHGSPATGPKSGGGIRCLVPAA